MSYDSCKSAGWIKLLDGARKFELIDLLVAIETYLIDQENEWIQQNVLSIHKYATSTVSLNKLQAYCNRMIVSHPDIIFKSNDLATLPKETLITLLKNDELSMDEDDIWMSVIQWATKQLPELELGTDPDDWSSNVTNTIKDTIADCIPHIRLFSISPKKVILYEDLLPKKLRHDILNYHTDKDYKLNIPLLPPRTGQAPSKAGHVHGCYIDSTVIDKRRAEWILSKIVESTKRLQKNQVTSIRKDDDYKLTLLYRRSRDGNSTEKFRELCSGKGPTVAVGKVSGTEEILGGYNPLAWSFQDLDYGRYVGTKESFIFAQDKNVDRCILSFVVDNSHAVYERKDFFPFFGGGSDLFFGSDSGAKPYANKKSYQFPIRSSSDYFEWADWEVFLVSKL